ncbi:hypothetical protein LS482_08605 [Sinomicrobium kalidii]|uniref:hypothetical protein n=1 Tax=Sinomicrobium kalidii TaxID=2900738 RepID=UPI001E573223|nr:hypothetical protein [Sinomicrobium kalidii]UGU17927.1 hypothetical protein LS482_08605 [Sinomicrobium kalidii]
MKKYFLIAVVTVITVSCRSQDGIVKSLSCEGNVDVQYEKADAQARKEGLVADKNLESFIVHFLYDFDGQVKGYVNNKLLFNEYIKTNEATDKTGKYFGYSYAKDQETPILKVVTDKGNCFDIRINRDYKLVYVYFSETERWTVRFSNIHYAEH